jgi:TRAP-type C4-dicarboxylate transport system substrate-binding protein
MKKIAAVFGMTLGLIFGAGPAAAEDKIELKLSHFLPPTHPMHLDFFEPWAKELERRTGGKVVVRVFPGTSSLGNVANQMDQAQAGVVDIAHGLSGIPRGRFPRTEIMQLPYMAVNADQATRTLNAMLPKYLAEEYKGVKVLVLHAHNNGDIHTRSKKVEKLEDLKGLRIRAPSATVGAMLDALGATSVGMPPGQMYENLEKGVIDGAALPWDGVKGFRVDELVKFHLEAGIYNSTFYFVMNQKKYDSLPADVRKAIDDISGDNLVPKFGPWWNAWDKLGLDAVKARGNTITPLSAAEQVKFQNALKPMIEKELGALEKGGVPNAREIYAEMLRQKAAYRK